MMPARFSAFAKSWIFFLRIHLHPSTQAVLVSELVEIVVKKGRQTKKKLKLGICGEHGGDLASIDFCNKVGQDYVSCSPPRVPGACLAAAQAALKAKQTLCPTV